MDWREFARLTRCGVWELLVPFWSPLLVQFRFLGEFFSSFSGVEPCCGAWFLRGDIGASCLLRPMKSFFRCV